MSEIYLTLKEFSEMFAYIDTKDDVDLEEAPMEWMGKVLRGKKYDVEMSDFLIDAKKDVRENLKEKIDKRKSESGPGKPSTEQWAATMAVGTLKCQRIYPGSSFQTFGAAWSAMEAGNAVLDPEQSELVSNAMLMSIKSKGAKTPVAVCRLAGLVVELAWSTNAQDRISAGNVAALIGRLYPTHPREGIDSEVPTT